MPEDRFDLESVIDNLPDQPKTKTNSPVPTIQEIAARIEKERQANAIPPSARTIQMIKDLEDNDPTIQAFRQGLIPPVPSGSDTYPSITGIDILRGVEFDQVLRFFANLYCTNPILYDLEINKINTDPIDWLKNNSKYIPSDINDVEIGLIQRSLLLKPEFWPHYSCAVTHEDLIAMVDNKDITSQRNLLGLCAIKELTSRPHQEHEELPPRVIFESLEEEADLENFLKNQSQKDKSSLRKIEIASSPYCLETTPDIRIDERLTFAGKKKYIQNLDIPLSKVDNYLKSSVILCDLIHYAYHNNPTSLRIELNQNKVIKRDSSKENGYFKLTNFARAFNELFSRKFIRPQGQVPITGRNYFLSQANAIVQYEDCCVVYTQTIKNQGTFENCAKDLSQKDIVDALLLNETIRTGHFPHEKYDWFKEYSKRKLEEHIDKFSDMLNVIDSAPRTWYTNSSFRNYIQGWSLARLDLDSVFWMPWTHDSVTLLDDPAKDLDTNFFFSLDYALGHNTITQNQAEQLQRWYDDKDERPVFDSVPKEVQEQLFANRILRHYTIILDRLKEFDNAEPEHKEYLLDIIPKRHEKIIELIQGTKYESLLEEELKELNLDRIQ